MTTELALRVMIPSMVGLDRGGNANSPSGNDTLSGLAGDDRLFGGTGNDTYIIDRTSDSIIEAANAGIDTVISSVSYTLGNNLENLTLTGSRNINGTFPILKVITS